MCILVACSLCGNIFSVCLSVSHFSLSVPGCLFGIFLHNLFSAGLPAGVLISFVWVLAGLTIGWLAIAIHQYNLQNAAVKAVQVGLEGMWRTNSVERA